MKINIIPCTNGPKDKLADAELLLEDLSPHFAGVKIVGFSIWKSRYSHDEVNVTFPARTYTTGTGEKRSYSFIRAIDDDPRAGQALKDAIIKAYNSQV